MKGKKKTVDLEVILLLKPVLNSLESSGSSPWTGKIMWPSLNILCFELECSSGGSNLYPYVPRPGLGFEFLENHGILYSDSLGY